MADWSIDDFLSGNATKALAPPKTSSLEDFLNGAPKVSSPEVAGPIAPPPSSSLGDIFSGSIEGIRQGFKSLTPDTPGQAASDFGKALSTNPIDLAAAASQAAQPKDVPGNLSQMENDPLLKNPGDSQPLIPTIPWTTGKNLNAATEPIGMAGAAALVAIPAFEALGAAGATGVAIQKILKGFFVLGGSYGATTKLLDTELAKEKDPSTAAWIRQKVEGVIDAATTMGLIASAKTLPKSDALGSRIRYGYWEDPQATPAPKPPPGPPQLPEAPMEAEVISRSSSPRKGPIVTPPPEASPEVVNPPEPPQPPPALEIPPPRSAREEAIVASIQGKLSQMEGQPTKEQVLGLLTTAGFRIGPRASRLADHILASQPPPSPPPQPKLSGMMDEVPDLKTPKDRIAIQQGLIQLWERGGMQRLVLPSGTTIKAGEAGRKTLTRWALSATPDDVVQISDMMIEKQATKDGGLADRSDLAPHNDYAINVPNVGQVKIAGAGAFSETDLKPLVESNIMTRFLQMADGMLSHTQEHAGTVLPKSGGLPVTVRVNRLQLTPHLLAANFSPEHPGGGGIGVSPLAIARHVERIVGPDAPPEVAALKFLDVTRTTLGAHEPAHSLPHASHDYGHDGSDMEAIDTLGEFRHRYYTQALAHLSSGTIKSTPFWRALTSENNLPRIYTMYQAFLKQADLLYGDKNIIGQIPQGDPTGWPTAGISGMASVVGKSLEAGLEPPASIPKEEWTKETGAMTIGSMPFLLPFFAARALAKGAANIIRVAGQNRIVAGLASIDTKAGVHAMTMLASGVATALNNLGNAGAYMLVGTVADSLLWASAKANLPGFVKGSHTLGEFMPNKEAADWFKNRLLARVHTSSELGSLLFDAAHELSGKGPRGSATATEATTMKVLDELASEKLAKRRWGFFSDEVQLPGGGTKLLTIPEKVRRFAMGLNFLQEMVIRQNIAKQHLIPFLKANGLSTTAELGPWMMLNKANEEKGKNALVNAMSQALQITSAEGPTHKDVMYPQRKELDTATFTGMYSKLPFIAKIGVFGTPFGNFLFNNLWQQLMESDPITSALPIFSTKRTRNSVQFYQKGGIFDQAEAARLLSEGHAQTATNAMGNQVNVTAQHRTRVALADAALKAARATRNQPAINRAQADLDVARLQRDAAINQAKQARGAASKTAAQSKAAHGLLAQRVQGLRDEGLRDAPQMASRQLYAGILVTLGALTTAYELKRQKDTPQGRLKYGQIPVSEKDAQGFQDVKNIDPALGLDMGFHFALGQWAVKYYNGELGKSRKGYTNMATFLTEAFSSRRGGTITTDLPAFLKEFTENEPMDVVNEGLEKFAFATGKLLSNFPVFKVINAGLQATYGGEYLKERAGESVVGPDTKDHTMVKALGRGLISNIPGFNQDLPPRYDPSSGRIIEEHQPWGSLLFGRVKSLSPVEAFIQAHEAEIDRRAVYPKQSAVPEYNRVMMEEWRKLLESGPVNASGQRDRPQDSVLATIKRTDLSTDAKVLKVTQDMSKDRDLAHIVARKYALENHIMLPPPLVRQQNEAADRLATKKENPQAFRPLKTPPGYRTGKAYQKNLLEKAKKQQEENK